MQPRRLVLLCSKGHREDALATKLEHASPPFVVDVVTDGKQLEELLDTTRRSSFHVQVAAIAVFESAQHDRWQAFHNLVSVLVQREIKDVDVMVVGNHPDLSQNTTVPSWLQLAVIDRLEGLRYPGDDVSIAQAFDNLQQSTSSDL